VFKRRGWHPSMTDGMDSIGPGFADELLQTPIDEAHRRVAPRLEDWPVLVRRVSEVVKLTALPAAVVPFLDGPSPPG
jgi:hypothetical protein